MKIQLINTNNNKQQQLDITQLKIYNQITVQIHLFLMRTQTEPNQTNYLNSSHHSRSINLERTQRSISRHRSSPKEKLPCPKYDFNDKHFTFYKIKARVKQNNNNNKNNRKQKKQISKSTQHYDIMNQKNIREMSTESKKKLRHTTIHKCLFTKEFDYGHLEKSQKSYQSEKSKKIEQDILDHDNQNHEKKSLLDIEVIQPKIPHPKKKIEVNNNLKVQEEIQVLKKIKEDDKKKTLSNYQFRNNQNHQLKKKMITENFENLELRVDTRCDQDKENINPKFLYPPNQQHYQLDQQENIKKPNTKIKRKFVSKIISTVNNGKIETKIITIPSEPKIIKLNLKTMRG